MNAVFFRIIGVLSLLMGAVLLYFVVRELASDHMTPERLPAFCTRVGAILVLLTLCGIGLLYLRKWAAVFASAFFTYYAARFLYEVYPLQGGRTWLASLITLVLIIPPLATIKFWRALRPGGRWYF